MRPTRDEHMPRLIPDPGVSSIAYGLTTVVSRLDGPLPKTLASLASAGFEDPYLFIDGKTSHPFTQSKYRKTIRDTPLLTVGNWMAGAWELYVHNPVAKMFLMFQDDFVTYRGLRKYLEQVQYPLGKGYYNLYTFPHNEPKEKTVGWHPSDQYGRGAVALLFTNQGLRDLLTSKYMIDRVQNAQRGWRNLDGGIVTAMKEMEYTEYIHHPSLVQHIGMSSSIGNKQHKQAESFRGEQFDALDLLCPVEV